MKLRIKKWDRTGSHGFTRLDAVACVCAVGLIMITLGPALGKTGGRQDEVVCANNLRLISGGFAAFANEHREMYPWQLPSPEWGDVWVPNLWFKFFALSNYVYSPRILADPADHRQPRQPSLSIATSWGSAEGGLVHPARRNNAISYFVSQFGTPLHPQTIISGDRNLLVEREFGDHGTFGRREAIDPATTTWSDEVHRRVGHVAFTDGVVERTDTRRLREIAGWWTEVRNRIQLSFPTYVAD